MKLLATFDESYGPQNDYLVLGGYAATYPAWQSFTSDWQALLDANDVSGFHSTDIRSGSKLFGGMPIEQRIDFIVEAEAIANRHLGFRYWFAINQLEYKQHYASGLLGVRKESAYGMCFRSALTSIRMFAEHALGTSPMVVDFLVESGHRNERDLQRVFEDYRGSVTPPLVSPFGTLTFAGKDDVRLHAADAMAYAGWRDIELNGSGWADDAAAKLEPIDPVDPCPVMRGMLTVATLQEYRERVLSVKAERMALAHRRKTFGQ